jgi:hypothetical protein
MGTAPADLPNFLERLRGTGNRLNTPTTINAGLGNDTRLAPLTGAGVTVRTPIPFGNTTTVEPRTPAYTIVDLGALEGKERFIPVAINNQGYVVGSRVLLTERMLPRKRDGKLRPVGFKVKKRWGVIRRDGIEITIPALPGFPFTMPVAINNRGEVVGISSLADPAGQSFEPLSRDLRVFSWQDGKTNDLKLIKQALQAGFDLRDSLPRLSPNGILFNDQGHLVVQVPTPGANSMQAYLFHQGRLSTVYAANSRWLNNKGVLLGWDRESFGSGTPGGVTYLFDLNTKGSQALPPQIENPRAFNDVGQILCVETMREATGVRSAFRLWSEGRLTPLATLDAPTGPMAMNNRGQIAGMVEGGRGAETVLPGPYLFSNNKLYDLNNAGVTRAGWHILSIYSLNDRGEMLAMAKRSDKALRAVLMRPETLTDDLRDDDTPSERTVVSLR